jgi:hypothetical protein
MRRSWLIVAAVCGVLGLGGCFGGDDGDDSGGSPAATPTPAAGTEETATPTPTATVEGGTEGALAQRTVKARGSRSTTVDIAVLGLEVQGKLAQLTLSFAAHDPEAAPDDSPSLYELNDQQPLYVTLVDPVNLRRYNVVSDSGGQKLESGAVETAVPIDGSTDARYMFAAPPPDVTEIDVSVGDWPTFRDVPIQR